MFVRYITRVRRAAPAVRTRHAFLWAVAVTGSAGALWVLSLSSVLAPLPDGSATATDDLPRPWASFFERAKEQVAAIGGAAKTPEPDDTVPEGWVANAPVNTMELSPEALSEARARAAIEYVPPAVTISSSTATSSTASSSRQIGQPRVVRIATTTGTVASTTASPGR